VEVQILSRAQNNYNFMSKIFFSLKKVHKIIQDSKPSKVCLVTSVKLAEELSWAIKKLNIEKSQIILLPDGEKAKDWKEIERLLLRFISMGLDRKSLIIAFGGGTIGDSVGFATAIYLRGINYIQIPTTLLAQVDSAHGGKTGINFQNYKNQIGSFHLPIAVIIDTRFINSLPKEQIISGLGEIIKAGFIKDVSILSLLKKHTVSDFVTSSDLEKVVKKSIAVKEYFVSKDFEDSNLRSVLNVGHTFGHAIELKYKISHGMAVIMGMLQEFAFTESQKLTASSVRENLENLLCNLGIKVDTILKADFKIITHDKKIIGNNILFPVVESEGKVKLISLPVNKFIKK
jgi:3-dehydroquinate synthase